MFKYSFDYNKSYERFLEALVHNETKEGLDNAPTVSIPSREEFIRLRTQRTYNVRVDNIIRAMLHPNTVAFSPLVPSMDELYSPFDSLCIGVANAYGVSLHGVANTTLASLGYNGAVLLSDLLHMSMKDNNGVDIPLHTVHEGHLYVPYFALELLAHDAVQNYKHMVLTYQKNKPSIIGLSTPEPKFGKGKSKSKQTKKGN